MAGFVTSSPLPCSHHPGFVSRAHNFRSRQGAFKVSRRCNLRMCAPEEDDIGEGQMQGPSQAPTKDGISTAGLAELDAEFIKACYLPDVEKVDKMLDDGIDHNITDVNGRTALHFCAGNGLHTICRKLLDLGADINKQDVMGLTPLHMATGYKKVDTVRFLLEANADANIASYRDQLPVELAESMLEKTPEKRLFLPNGEHAKLKELVDLLDKATEEEDDDDEDEDEDEEETELDDENREIIEETESAKFVVRVKPKGSPSPPPSPTVKAEDVKVTIRVKEPETQK